MNYDSPSPEWYEPADIIDEDDELAPDPTEYQAVALTEKGNRLLALLRCRNLQPGGWPWLATELDRRIACLLDDVGAD